MSDNEIKPGTCYQLASGKIIRVTSVYSGQVRYDLFDEQERKWKQSPTPFPIMMLKEQKTCPVPRAINRANPDPRDS